MHLNELTVSVLADNLLMGRSVKLAKTTTSGKSGAKLSSGAGSSVVDLPFLSLGSLRCFSSLLSLPLMLLDSFDFLMFLPSDLLAASLSPLASSFISDGSYN